MDPDTALEVIRDATDDSDVAKAAQALDEWIMKGGFLPTSWQRMQPFDYEGW